MAQVPKRRSQTDVAREYGHPWPWYERELVETHAVEADIDCRDLAERWGCPYKKLARWIRTHGFRVVDYHAVR